MQGLNTNFEQHNSYLETLNHSFSITAVSETWINDNNVNYLNMPGYTLVSKARATRGGGVALYVQYGFSCLIRDDIMSLYISNSLPTSNGTLRKKKYSRHINDNNISNLSEQH